MELDNELLNFLHTDKEFQTGLQEQLSTMLRDEGAQKMLNAFSEFSGITFPTDTVEREALKIQLCRFCCAVSFMTALELQRRRPQVVAIVTSDDFEDNAQPTHH